MENSIGNMQSTGGFNYILLANFSELLCSFMAFDFAFNIICFIHYLFSFKLERTNGLQVCSLSSINCLAENE